MNRGPSADFQLVFEGPIDNDSATLQRLKGVLIADLEYSITDVQRFLSEAPLTIRHAATREELEVEFEKLRSSGANVLILQPSLFDRDAHAAHGLSPEQSRALDIDDMLWSEDPKPGEDNRVEVVAGHDPLHIPELEFDLAANKEVSPEAIDLELPVMGALPLKKPIQEAKPTASKTTSTAKTEAFGLSIDELKDTSPEPARAAILTAETPASVLSLDPEMELAPEPPADPAKVAAKNPTMTAINDALSLEPEPIPSAPEEIASPKTHPPKPTVAAITEALSLHELEPAPAPLKEKKTASTINAQPESKANAAKGQDLSLSFEVGEPDDKALPKTASKPPAPKIPVKGKEGIGGLAFVSETPATTLTEAPPAPNLAKPIIAAKGSDASALAGIAAMDGAASSVEKSNDPISVTAAEAQTFEDQPLKQQMKKRVEPAIEEKEEPQEQSLVKAAAAPIEVPEKKPSFFSKLPLPMDIVVPVVIGAVILLTGHLVTYYASQPELSDLPPLRLHQPIKKKISSAPAPLISKPVAPETTATNTLPAEVPALAQKDPGTPAALNEATQPNADEGVKSAATAGSDDMGTPAAAVTETHAQEGVAPSSIPEEATNAPEAEAEPAGAHESGGVLHNMVTVPLEKARGVAAAVEADGQSEMDAAAAALATNN